MLQPVLPLGHTVVGNKPVALSGIDFERHKHIIGISGSGKSSFIASIALFLLRLGIAFCLIDPHGDLCLLILSLLASSSSNFFSKKKAYERLRYINFNRQDAAIAWNILYQVHINNYTVAQNFLESIHRAFPSSFGTTTSLDNTIEYAAFVLAECGLPITQLQRFLIDTSFRNTLLDANIHDQQIRQFFDYKFSDKVSPQVIDAAMRRLNLLTFSPTLRHALSQKNNRLNFRYLMDNNISCIINLSGLSDAEKRLAGCLLMTSLEQSFLSRATMPVEKRTPYHVIVDEFPLFSASDDSFSTILEQVRKYSGTLYLAHQSISQLSKSISGSLQNAISILFKLGYEDSTWATQRFVRHEKIQEPSLLDKLLGRKQQATNPFTQVTNSQDAKQIFESLERQMAILTINNQALLIRTHTIPNVQLDKKKLEEIEQEYARLLTPLSQIEQEQTASNLVLVSPLASSLAKRRVPRSCSPLTPFQTFVGAAGNDEQLQAIFSLYGYLTVAQVAKLLCKSENAVRNKLNRCVSVGILEQQSQPRTTPSGKTPFVYSVKKRVRKHEFLDHALATSEILLNTALLPTLTSLTLIDLQSDQHLKASPIKLADGSVVVPDGMARIASQDYEYTIYFEIDRNSEFQKEKIVSKLNNYKMLASQRECMVVAFCVVEGSDLRVKTLRNWAADVVPDAYRELFLFAAIDLDNLSPDTLFLRPLWLSVGDTTSQPLIEP